MLDWLRRRRNAPVEIMADVEIGGSLRDLFAAIDPASPDNRYVRCGQRLEPDTTDPDRFSLSDPRLPGHPVLLTVTERQPGRGLTIRSDFPEGQDVGALRRSMTAYGVEMRGEERCRVMAAFIFELFPLTRREREQEVGLLQFAVHDDLARLKALIEEGPEAAASAGALDGLFRSFEGAA